MLVVRSAAGITGSDPGPSQSAACELPSFAYLPRPLMQTHLRPGRRAEGEPLVLGSGDSAWNVGSSATEKAGDGEIGTQKREQAHSEKGAGVEGERRDSETETVKRRENQIGNAWIERLNVKSREGTEKKSSRERTGKRGDHLCPSQVFPI